MQASNFDVNLYFLSLV